MKYIFLNDHIKDAFFWDYSRMKEKRIKMPAFFWVTFQFQNEPAEYYSGHSAPEGAMNRNILKTVYSEEQNKRSKKCSFRKIHESAILF